MSIYFLQIKEILPPMTNNGNIFQLNQWLNIFVYLGGWGGTTDDGKYISTELWDMKHVENNKK